MYVGAMPGKLRGLGLGLILTLTSCIAAFLPSWITAAFLKYRVSRLTVQVVTYSRNRRETPEGISGTARIAVTLVDLVIK